MTAPIEVRAWQADGSPRPNAVKLPADTFDGTVNDSVMHQAVKNYLANQRQGTVKTKTRGLVSGGNQKPWRQKGTGRARAGSIRSPLWPGGGTTFGPQPRDYRVSMPKKQRQLARRSALNARAREEALTVVAQLAFDAPKTKQMAELIWNMGLDGRKVLVLTNELNTNVVLSARNIPEVDVMRYADASTYDILHADSIVIEEAALGELESGAEVEVVKREPKAKREQRRKDADAKPAAKKKTAAKKTAPKAAAKKAPAKKAAKKTAPKAAAKKAPAKKTAAKKKKKD
jgi:large subunit ribosomal protein L4